MTEQVYLQDSYLKELDATVVEVINARFLVLDKTIFYAQGGGQPFDLGTITFGAETFNVLSVKKVEGKILHEVDKNGIKVGNNVNCKIDWNRRYQLMRMHTAAHLFSSLLYTEAKILVTGNQLDIETSKMDFNLDEINPEKIKEYINKSNELIKKGAAVKVYTLPREEAFKIPGIVKLAGALPPEVAELRIVEIDGIDIEADGGTHVRDIKEIKGIELVSLENKGKGRKRVYFKLQA
ncbi:MAG: alanyl-tRNA editing protein AlaXM [Candidatus Nanoarchaeia archaeon]